MSPQQSSVPDGWEVVETGTIPNQAQPVMRAPTTADPVTLGELQDNPVEAMQRIGAILKKDVSDPKLWLSIAAAYFGPKVLTSAARTMPTRATVGKVVSGVGGVMESPIAGALSPRASHVGRMLTAAGEQLQVPRTAAPVTPPAPVAAPTPATPAPVPEPIAAPAAPVPEPVASSITAKFNPSTALQQAKDAFAAAKATPQPGELSWVTAYMKAGLSAEAAVAKALTYRPASTMSAAEQLAKRLGTPSDAEVASTVATKNLETSAARGGTKPTPTATSAAAAPTVNIRSSTYHDTPGFSVGWSDPGRPRQSIFITDRAIAEQVRDAVRAGVRGSALDRIAFPKGGTR